MLSTESFLLLSLVSCSLLADINVRYVIIWDILVKCKAQMCSTNFPFNKIFSFYYTCACYIWCTSIQRICWTDWFKNVLLPLWMPLYTYKIDVFARGFCHWFPLILHWNWFLILFSFFFCETRKKICDLALNRFKTL